MFTKAKSKGVIPLEGQPERFDTLVGQHTRMEGRLVVRESVRIDGTVVGDIDAPPDRGATVVIAPSGEVQGNISARRIIVAGSVAGHLHASGSVELLAGCLVQGDIKYGSIAVEHGAQVLGLLLKLDAPVEVTTLPAPQDARAVLKRVQAG